LITHVKTLFGEAGLHQLIDARESQARVSYAARMQAAPDLAARLQALAAIRREEGYMAEVRQEPDGSWVLAENHCPICAAATQCQQFCRSELALFQQLLGPEVNVRRDEHILAGARRCAYRIQLI
jgi:predicted ArsR family transcriptional regulator